MQTMLAAAIVATLALAGPARAVPFVNLDFEQGVPTPAQPFGLPFVEWSDAAPGWSHSAGADTGFVYYGTTHVGVTQWFALTGAQSLPAFLLSGTQSFAFNSGYAASSGPGSPFVQATLSQTGTVPADALSLRLRALGPLAVFLGNAPVALQSLGGGLYGGDIAAFAGQTLELRLVNLSTGFGSPVAVDDIVFSNLAVVPEAPTAALFGAGLLAGLAMARRRQRRGSIGRCPAAASGGQCDLRTRRPPHDHVARPASPHHRAALAARAGARGAAGPAAGGAGARRAVGD